MRKNSIKNTRINAEVGEGIATGLSEAGADVVIVSRHQDGSDEAAKAVVEGLRSAVGYIRKELARRVNLRNTPEIKFILDQSIEYGVNMSRLIDDVTKDLKDDEEE